MFTENEERYIYESLNFIDIRKIKRVLFFAKNHQFWKNVINNPDRFIKNFHKMESQLPKIWSEMTEKEQFLYMVKRIYEKEPLSKGAIFLDFTQRTVYEKHYKRTIPMDVGAIECHRRIMELYGKT